MANKINRATGTNTMLHVILGSLTTDYATDIYCGGNTHILFTMRANMLSSELNISVSSTI